MKPIEGLNLAEIAEQARRDTVQEQIDQTKRKIAIIIGKHYAARGSVADLERQLAKVKERLAKEQAKLEALTRGDWSVLQDDKEQNQPEEKENQ